MTATEELPRATTPTNNEPPKPPGRLRRMLSRLRGWWVKLWRKPLKTDVGRWWVTSVLLAVGLLLVLMLMLVRRDHQDPREGPDAARQLVDAAAVEDDLANGEFRKARDDPQQPLIQIRTGAFIQSLEFESENDVHLTGYLWQRFDGDVRDDFRRGSLVPVADGTDAGKMVRPGFILPEQVDSNFEIEFRGAVFNGEPADGATTGGEDAGAADEDRGGDEPVSSTTSTTTSTTSTTTTTTTTTVPRPPVVTETTMGPTLFGSPRPAAADERPGVGSGTTTILYYFEAPIRQPFTYNDYPFDDKIVTVRIWSADFENNVVLVPDFASYPCIPEQPKQFCTGEEDEFGIDPSIVLGDFERANTYFDFERLDYNSNFGNDTFRQDRYPELQFNVLIRRNLVNPLISNLVPLFVAAGLAFGVLMTITRDDEKAKRFDFSTTQVMTTLAGLFLAVLIAQQQIRSQFAGVVYLEYFYFLIYLVLLGVGVIAILVSVPRVRDSRLFEFGGDLLLIKTLYWPTLLFAAIALTRVTLW